MVISLPDLKEWQSISFTSNPSSWAPIVAAPAALSFVCICVDDMHDNFPVLFRTNLTWEFSVEFLYD
jgi:hypothetical protein